MNSPASRLLPFFLFLSCLSRFALFAEEPPELPPLTKKNWTVSIARPEGHNLAERHLYLLDSLPRLLREKLGGLEEHVLSEEERLHLGRRHLETLLSKEKRSLSSLYEGRDKLLFSQETGAALAEQYRRAEEDIRKKETLLEAWGALSPRELELPQTLPLLFQDAEASPVKSRIDRYLDRIDRDLMIVGRIDRVEELFFLELASYRRGKESPSTQWSGTGAEEELDELVAQAAAALRADLLGRSWAALSLRAEPASSIIKLDGQTMGVGSLSLLTAEPGFRTLQVENKGFVSQSRQIYLPALEETELAVRLEEGSRRELHFFSDPPGADVYYGSQWIGATPLSAAEPPFAGDIKIALEGYKPFHSDLSAWEGESLTVVFDERAYDKDLAFNGAKSRFYRSLGWFGLSVGVPLVLYGIYQNEANLYYNYQGGGFPDKAQTHYDRANRYYYGFLGGVAVSGALLVNSLFQLNKYIKAAEESTED